MAALIAALIAANVFACTDKDVVGPALAGGINSALELLSPKKGNVLTVDDDELLYVAAPVGADLLSEDSVNVLRVGSDGLLFVPEGKGKVGPQGPAGPKGDKGDPGEPGQDGRSGRDGVGLTTRSYGSCIGCNSLPSYTVEIDDPGNNLLVGLVLLQCHTEDEGEHYTVDCGAMHMGEEGKTVISASGKPAHDTGSFVATLIGNF